MVAIRAGDLDAAEAHLERALLSCQKADSPTFTSLMCHVYAHAALRRKTPAGRQLALEMLTRSQEINVRCGFHGIAAAVRWTAARAGLGEQIAIVAT